MFVYLQHYQQVQVYSFSAGFTHGVDFLSTVSVPWQKSETSQNFFLYTQLLFYLAKVMVYIILVWFEHIYFSQNRRFSGHARFFLLQDCYNRIVFFLFFPHEMGETGRLPGENFMFVCAIILLFENIFIFLVCLPQLCKLTCSEQRFGRLEVFNDQIESLPLAQGVSCLCKFGL